MTMNHLRGLGQNQAPIRPAPEAAVPAIAPAAKEIPYDYVARFVLTGVRGRRVEDVINISIEGAFVAVAIGYSFIPGYIFIHREPEPAPTPIELGTPMTNAAISPVSTMKEAVSQLTISIQDISNQLTRCLQRQLCGIDFKYSIVDSGSGRELQNQPIHNIAGLGKADGDRPFRPFAKPMVFMPRSTIRIAVDEVSAGDIYTGAELFIVLHGYKMLGYGTALP
jgi:hypothetical protein